MSSRYSQLTFDMTAIAPFITILLHWDYFIIVSDSYMLLEQLWKMPTRKQSIDLP
jgi:hypothetical protein